MSYTIAQIEDHLIGMGHGNSLNKVRNKYAAYERAANMMRSHCDVITTKRRVPLTQSVHDDVYKYAVASDYGKLIDLYPNGERQSSDFARRVSGVTFDLLKAVQQKRVSVDSENGARFLRINWDKTPAKTLASMNSLTGWSVGGGGSNLTLDTLYAISGGKSIRFDTDSDGSQIENAALAALDLEDWDEQADFFAYVYLPSTTNFTSVQLLFGNDLTTNYWTATAQTTQADGTAVQTGWNLFKFSWAGATETGTVDPSAIDSVRVLVTTDAAVSGVRVDNITVSLGHIFEHVYYSAYLFTNSAGTWIRQPSTDSDNVMVDELGLNIFLHECLVAMAQQMEGEDSSFDIQFALNVLDRTGQRGLYAKYRAEYPSQSKREQRTYFSLPRKNPF